MTAVIINDILPRVQAIAIAGQTIYSTNFTADVAADVVVFSRGALDFPDDATQILSPSQYNVAFIGSGQIVQVTLLTPSSAGDVITITRLTPVDRDNLYTNTNFTPSMLNGDFGRFTFQIQENDMYNTQLSPSYPQSALIETADLILPQLGPGESWVMNGSRTAILAMVAGGSAGDVLAQLASHAPGEGASLVGLNPSGTVQDLANNKFIIQIPNATTPNAQALSALATGILKSTTSTGVVSISLPLTSIDNLTTSADKMIYTTASNVYATTDLTPFARTLLDDTTAAAAAATLAVLPLAGGTMSGQINMGNNKIINMADGVSAQDAATINNISGSLGAYLPLTGGTMSGVINMGNNKITNVTNPSNPQDAATLNYLTSNYLPLAGGTMSGVIGMGNNKITNLLDPTNPQDAATLFYVNDQLGNYLPLSGGTMTGIINMNSHKITGVTDPTNSQDAATKAYVDLVASGLTVQGACYAATTANLTAIYANGAAGIGATLTNSGAMAAFTVDGTTPPVNSRILVKDQSSTLQNGIYILTDTGSVITNWILTRATDYDQPSEISPGDLVIVNNGTANGGASWVETATVTTIGTDPILFSQFTFAASAVLLKANNLSDVASTTTSFNNISPLTTKGDLIGFSTQNVRVAVGATNGQILQVDSSAAVGLSYSTATFPATTTINQILFSSSSNVISGISSLAGGVLVTNSSSVPQMLTNPAVASKMLLSANAAIPTWSTSTIPTSAGATANKVLLSDGTNYVLSTPTFPNASATSGKIIVSDGTNWIASTPTFPNTSAATGKIIISDGTNWIASTPTYPNTIASAGKILISDGTNFVASTPTYPNTSASAGKILISDGTNYIASTPTYPNTSGTSGKFLISDGTNNVYSTSTIPTSAGATANKILLSDGTNYILSTPTFPNASATIRKIIVSDGTNWVASTETYAVPGTSGNVLTSDGTNWTSVAPAATAQNPFICQGRLTLTTATPVTTSDVMAATSFYWTPYKGNQIALYDGSSTWTTLTFTEITTAVPSSTSTMYDVFAYNNAGTVTIETLAWTNDTTRATALVFQNGVYVKSGATTRRYLGSIRTTTVSGQCEDSLVKRYVWNYYNRVMRSMLRTDSTASWTYTTATYRQANAAAANQLDAVVGVLEDSIYVQVTISAQTNSGSILNAVPGIGLNSTTAQSATLTQNTAFVASTTALLLSQYNTYPPSVGRNTYVWIEASSAVGTTTWLNKNTALSGTGMLQSGISGYLFG